MIAMLLAVTVAIAPTYTKEQLISAIHKVESGGKMAAPDGDNGNAIGPLQIWKACWQDSGVSGVYEECKTLDYAKRVFWGYAKRYSKNEWKDRMTLKDCEKIARRWNGGPKGDTKKATQGYWIKVQKFLKKP